MRVGSVALFCVVTFAYAAANLLFDAGLDDTVVQIASARSVHDASLSELVSSIHALITTPSDEGALYRPLRTSYSWSLYFLKEHYAAWIPDILSSIVAGICAVVLRLTFLRCGLSSKASLWSALWSFTCVPVVSMGLVVHVNQFAMILGLYGTLLLVNDALRERSAWRLLPAWGVVFVLSLYGEAMLLAPIAVGVGGGFYLLRGEKGAAWLSFLFAAVGVALVFGNGTLLTGSVDQFVRNLRAVFLTRGYDPNVTTHPGLIGAVRRYFESYRVCLFTGVFFSVGPTLLVLALIALARKHFTLHRLPVLLGIAGVTLCCAWNPAAGIGLTLLLFVGTSGTRYPLLAGMVASGLLVIGPIFIIDTHLTYFLPALCAILFSHLADAVPLYGGRLWKGTVAVVMAGLLAIACTNFAAGVFFSTQAARHNRELGERLQSVLHEEAVLANFRHAYDLFYHANSGRSLQEPIPDLRFTATVPLEDRDTPPIHDRDAFLDWLRRADTRGKRTYYLVAEHRRFKGKGGYHGPRFLAEPTVAYRLRDADVLDVSFPILDPGFLLVPAIYRRDLSAGFIGYPIFPDMIDDIGVEYTPFSRRLFATYRLLEVIPSGRRPGAKGEELPDDTCVLMRDYKAYCILMRGEKVFAAATDEGDGSMYRTRIESDRVEDVLRQIDRQVRRGRR